MLLKQINIYVFMNMWRYTWPTKILKPILSCADGLLQDDYCIIFEKCDDSIWDIPQSTFHFDLGAVPAQQVWVFNQINKNYWIISLWSNKLDLNYSLTLFGTPHNYFTCCKLESCQVNDITLYKYFKLEAKKWNDMNDLLQFFTVFYNLYIQMHILIHQICHSENQSSKFTAV